MWPLGVFLLAASWFSLDSLDSLLIRLMLSWFLGLVGFPEQGLSRASWKAVEGIWGEIKCQGIAFSSLRSLGIIKVVFVIFIFLCLIPLSLLLLFLLYFLFSFVLPFLLILFGTDLICHPISVIIFTHVCFLSFVFFCSWPIFLTDLSSCLFFFLFPPLYWLLLFLFVCLLPRLSFFVCSSPFL